MKVFILSWEYPPYVDGGLGRHVAELAPALAKNGVEVHVITPTGEPTVAQLFSQEPAGRTPGKKNADKVKITVEDGVTVHRVTTRHRHKSGNIYTRVTEANKDIESYADKLCAEYGGCELLHTHDWLTSFASVALQNRWNLSLIATIHATERGRSRGYLYNEMQWAINSAEGHLIHQANRVIVCSHYMFRELQEFFRAPKDKMRVVPNGVNIEAMQDGVANDNVAQFRAKFAEPDEKIVFTVARLVFEKGIHRLVDAAPQILKAVPETKIIIAGKGPESEHLKQQAENLNVADNVKFIGFVSDEDRDRLFKAADCAVFPSLYEPFGIVALEAMALDCPVVVSEVGGLAEVVTHQDTGLTIYPDDPQSVAWGVIEALKHPAITRVYASNARQWIEENFTWSRVAAQTKKVYQEILDQASANP